MHSAENALRGAILHALEWHDVPTAVFLAERLHAEVSTEESLHLLATCYARGAQPYRACAILKTALSAQCRYLYARCCFEMKKYQEAEMALLGTAYGDASLSIDDFKASNGMAYALMGDICRQSSRHTEATQWYQRAINENPFLWSAIENLSNAGVKLDFDVVFAEASVDMDHQPLVNPISNDDVSAQAQLHYQVPQLSRGNISMANESLLPEVMETPLTRILPASPVSSVLPLRGHVSIGDDLETPRMPRPLASHVVAPGSIVSSLGTPSPAAYVTPPITREPSVGREEIKAPKAAPRKAPPPLTPDIEGTPEPLAPIRRSNRLFGGASLAPIKLKSKAIAAPKEKEVPTKPIRPSRLRTSLENVQRTRSESPPRVSESSKNVQNAEMMQDQAVDAAINEDISRNLALRIIRAVAEAYQALSLYQCSKAVELFTALPFNQAMTAWVHCCIGRAHFELADYRASEQAYRMARRIEAHRVEGMEVFSTVLWHQRNETALSYLANEIVQTNRQCPEAWCIVGNCYSLQKDHDSAVKFFERAIQIDPNFTYAYTLLGHEYVYNDDFVQATACFRNALQHDPRHYNAWYGLGMILYRQEKYDMAEYHFM